MRSIVLVLALSLLSMPATADPKSAAASAPATAKTAKPAGDTAAPVIEHVPLRETVAGRSIEITAAIRDASGVSFPRLYYRTVGKSGFNQTTLVARGPHFVAIIPAFAVTTGGIEYYIEVFDKLGNGPAYHGTKMKTHRIFVRVKKAAVATSTPWYKRWWVWAIGGAVVAGSVTAIAIVATSGGENGGPPPAGATLVITAPAPSPTLPGLP